MSKPPSAAAVWTTSNRAVSSGFTRKASTGTPIWRDSRLADRCGVRFQADQSNPAKAGSHRLKPDPTGSSRIPQLSGLRAPGKLAGLGVHPDLLAFLDEKRHPDLEP